MSVQFGHEGAGGDTEVIASISDSSFALEWDSFGDGGYDLICNSDNSLDTFLWTQFPNIPKRLPNGYEANQRPFPCMWAEHTGRLWKSGSAYPFYQTSFDDDQDEYRSCASSDEYYSCESDQTDDEEVVYGDSLGTRHINVRIDGVTVKILVFVTKGNLGADHRETTRVNLAASTQCKGDKRTIYLVSPDDTKYSTCDTRATNLSEANATDNFINCALELESPSFAYDSKLKFEALDESRDAQEMFLSASSLSSVSSTLCNNQFLKKLLDPLENVAYVYNDYQLVSISPTGSDESCISSEESHFIAYDQRSPEYLLKDGEFIITDEFMEDSYIDNSDTTHTTANMQMESPWLTMYRKDFEADHIQTYLFGAIDNCLNSDESGLSRVLQYSSSCVDDEGETPLQLQLSSSEMTGTKISPSGQLPCGSDFDSLYMCKDNAYAFYKKEDTFKTVIKCDSLNEVKQSASDTPSTTANTTNTSCPSWDTKSRSEDTSLLSTVEKETSVEEICLCTDTTNMDGVWQKDDNHSMINDNHLEIINAMFDFESSDRTATDKGLCFMEEQKEKSLKNVENYRESSKQVTSEKEQSVTCESQSISKEDFVLCRSQYTSINTEDNIITQKRDDDDHGVDLNSDTCSTNAIHLVKVENCIKTHTIITEEGNQHETESIKTKGRKAEKGKVKREAILVVCDDQNNIEEFVRNEIVQAKRSFEPTENFASNSTHCPNHDTEKFRIQKSGNDKIHHKDDINCTTCSPTSVHLGDFGNCKKTQIISEKVNQSQSVKMKCRNVDKVQTTREIISVCDDQNKIDEFVRNALLQASRTLPEAQGMKPDRSDEDIHEIDVTNDNAYIKKSDILKSHQCNTLIRPIKTAKYINSDQICAADNKSTNKLCGRKKLNKLSEISKNFIQVQCGHEIKLNITGRKDREVIRSVIQNKNPVFPILNKLITTLCCRTHENNVGYVKRYISKYVLHIIRRRHHFKSVDTIALDKMRRKLLYITLRLLRKTVKRYYSFHSSILTDKLAPANKTSKGFVVEVVSQTELGQGIRGNDSQLSSEVNRLKIKIKYLDVCNTEEAPTNQDAPNRRNNVVPKSIDLGGSIDVKHTRTVQIVNSKEDNNENTRDSSHPTSSGYCREQTEAFEFLNDTFVRQKKSTNTVGISCDLSATACKTQMEQTGAIKFLNDTKKDTNTVGISCDLSAVVFTTPSQMEQTDAIEFLHDIHDIFERQKRDTNTVGISCDLSATACTTPSQIEQTDAFELLNDIFERQEKDTNTVGISCDLSAIVCKTSSQTEQTDVIEFVTDTKKDTNTVGISCDLSATVFTTTFQMEQTDTIDYVNDTKKSTNTVGISCDLSATHCEPSSQMEQTDAIDLLNDAKKDTNNVGISCDLSATVCKPPSKMEQTDAIEFVNDKYVEQNKDINTVGIACDLSTTDYTTSFLLESENSDTILSNVFVGSKEDAKTIDDWHKHGNETYQLVQKHFVQETDLAPSESFKGTYKKKEEIQARNEKSLTKVELKVKDDVSVEKDKTEQKYRSRNYKALEAIKKDEESFNELEKSVTSLYSRFLTQKASSEKTLRDLYSQSVTNKAPEAETSVYKHCADDSFDESTKLTSLSGQNIVTEDSSCDSLPPLIHTRNVSAITISTNTVKETSLVDIHTASNQRSNEGKQNFENVSNYFSESTALLSSLKEEEYSSKKFGRVTNSAKNIIQSEDKSLISKKNSSILGFEIVKNENLKTPKDSKTEEKNQHDYILKGNLRVDSGNAINLMEYENSSQKETNVKANILNKFGDETKRKEKEKQSSLKKFNADEGKLAHEKNEGNIASFDKEKQLLENSLEPRDENSSGEEEVLVENLDVYVENMIAVETAEINKRSYERLKVDVGSIAKRFTTNENKPVPKMRSIQSLKDLNIGIGALTEKFNANEDVIKEFSPMPNPKEAKAKNTRVITTPRGFST